MRDIRADGWVRKGLVWHNPAMTATRPEDEPFTDADFRRGMCQGCRKKVSKLAVRCRQCHDQHIEEMVVDRLMEVLARTLSKPTGTTICDDCHCLLTYPGETCPGCLAWSELNACATSWKAARIAYRPARNRLSGVAA